MLLMGYSIFDNIFQSDDDVDEGLYYSIFKKIRAYMKIFRSTYITNEDRITPWEILGIFLFSYFYLSENFGEKSF